MNKTSKKTGKGPAGIRRKTVGGTQTEWISVRPLLAEQNLPVVVQPSVDGMDLIEWATANRDRVDQLLLEHRALLFRGFGIDSVERFEKFVMATSNGELLEYVDRTTPRTAEGDRIYTATVHPADQTIHPHNEGTYWVRWAMKLYFCCLTAPERGGETPIADVRRVFERLSPAVRERFADHGFMLVRNFNDGFGLPWQEVFQTESSAEVEAYCRSHDIEFEWKDGGRLRTRQVRPAIRVHPVTKEQVWFNHAAFYHYTTLEPDVRQALTDEFGTEGLPYNTYYGDGSEIEPEVAEEIRAAYAAEKIVFPWQVGDVMLLDNMSVAHAREPFVGDRLVVVSMTDAVGEQDCAVG